MHDTSELRSFHDTPQKNVDVVEDCRKLMIREITGTNFPILIFFAFLSILSGDLLDTGIRTT